MDFMTLVAVMTKSVSNIMLAEWPGLITIVFPSNLVLLFVDYDNYKYKYIMNLR